MKAIVLFSATRGLKKLGVTTRTVLVDCRDYNHHAGFLWEHFSYDKPGPTQVLSPESGLSEWPR
jgi:hypothetical protein